MNRNGRWLCLLFVALLSGCASHTKDIEIDAQADPDIDFASYETYAWLGASAIVNDPNNQWNASTFDAAVEVKNQVDSRLQKRGMSEDTSDPDFLIGFAAGVDMEALDLKEDPDTKMDVLANVPQGGLVLVFVDAESGFVSWVGVATGDVQDETDDETIKKRLDYAVDQLIKKLPK